MPGSRTRTYGWLVCRGRSCRRWTCTATCGASIRRPTARSCAVARPLPCCRLRPNGTRPLAHTRAAHPSAALTAVVLSRTVPRFLTVQTDGRVESKPIKGTVRRGRSREEDDALRTELAESTKDFSENLMVPSPPFPRPRPAILASLEPTLGDSSIRRLSTCCATTSAKSAPPGAAPATMP